MFTPPPDFEWPKIWEPLSQWRHNGLEFGRVHNHVLGIDKPAPDLAKELQREVCEGHPLYRKTCHPVARSKEDPNEFLFLTDDPHFPLAFVHLTWTIERRPDFPYTLRYESWDAFFLAWTTDHLTTPQ
jgi:hypothetical protein